MAVAKSGNDRFSNMAIINLVESAANTLTFKKLETGISLSEKVAWVLHRLEYLVPAPHNSNFGADADVLYFGLSLANTFATPSLGETTIIDYNSYSRCDYGAAANTLIFQRPWLKDFSSMPGGGILIPPTPLYAWCVGGGLASAVTIAVRIHYTLMPMAISDYWELVEARRVLSS